MIYFLYGEDSYRAKEKLNDIVEGYKKVHQSGLNLLYFDAKGISFTEFYQQFNINSMFAEKKLAVLENVFQSKDFQEPFLEAVKKLNESKDILVISEESPDQRTKLFKTLLKESKAQEFAQLTPLQMQKWIAAEFAKYSSHVEGAAVAALAEAVNGDLWRASGEIKKLAFMKKGSAVTRTDVVENVAADIKSDIFKTIDALAKQDKKEASALLHRHLEQGENAIYLLTMIAYQFRNFLIVKELSEKRVPYPQIAKQSGLHPFVAQKSLAMAQSFSFVKLKKIYERIFQIDEQVKTGKIDAELAIDLLLAEI
jgi:DNA polymerase-3 subunit delta